MADALDALSHDPYYSRLSRTQIIRTAVVYLALQERYMSLLGTPDKAPHKRVSDALASRNTGTTTAV